MASMWSCPVTCVLLGLVLMVSAARAPRTSMLSPTMFDHSFNVLYGAETQVERTFDGRAVSLSMTQATGSGFQSKDSFLFGQLSLKIRLVPGDSAGVVVCFYMHSMTADHDEFDFEFLGNKSGEPIVLQTNIYANGNGGREERIALWFDPTEKFHTYTVLWNHKQVVFYVDSVPIRALKNNRASRGFFPLARPMWVFSSIWNGDDWATRGGLDKVDWASGPFVAHYKDFMLHGCAYDGKGVAPACTSPLYGDTWWSTHADLNQVERRKLAWVRSQYMVYDYCVDFERYNTTLYYSYPECEFSNRGY